MERQAVLSETLTHLSVTMSLTRVTMGSGWRLELLALQTPSRVSSVRLTEPLLPSPRPVSVSHISKMAIGNWQLVISVYHAEYS